MRWVKTHRISHKLASMVQAGILPPLEYTCSAVMCMQSCCKQSADANVMVVSAGVSSPSTNNRTSCCWPCSCPNCTKTQADHMSCRTLGALVLIWPALATTGQQLLNLQLCISPTPPKQGTDQVLLANITASHQQNDETRDMTVERL